MKDEVKLRIAWTIVILNVSLVLGLFIGSVLLLWMFLGPTVPVVIGILALLTIAFRLVQWAEHVIDRNERKKSLHE